MDLMLNEYSAAPGRTVVEVSGEIDVYTAPRLRETLISLVDAGNYRLIVAFKFKSQIAFIKFIGTHAEYDRIDPLTVSLF